MSDERCPTCKSTTKFVVYGDCDPLNSGRRTVIDPWHNRVVPVPDEDTHPSPSHSATMRELERARVERDAALARAEAAYAAARIIARLAQGELDMTVRAVTAEAEAQRLREGIERHRHRHDIGLTYHHPRPMDEALWALLAEQPETKA